MIHSFHPSSPLLHPHNTNFNLNAQLSATQSKSASQIEKGFETVLPCCHTWRCHSFQCRFCSCLLMCHLSLLKAQRLLRVLLQWLLRFSNPLPLQTKNGGILLLPQATGAGQLDIRRRCVTANAIKRIFSSFLLKHGHFSCTICFISFPFCELASRPRAPHRWPILCFWRNLPHGRHICCVWRTWRCTSLWLHLHCWWQMHHCFYLLGWRLPPRCHGDWVF